MKKATYLADKIILFDGIPSSNGIENTPCNVTWGINQLLKNINVTCRKDIKSYRPKINKLNSQKDIEQRNSNKYFY